MLKLRREFTDGRVVSTKILPRVGSGVGERQRVKAEVNDKSVPFRPPLSANRGSLKAGDRSHDRGLSPLATSRCRRPILTCSRCRDRP